MSNPLPGTIANVSGTCIGTGIGSITQEILSSRTADQLKQWMTQKSTEVEVSVKALLGEYSEPGRSKPVMYAPVKNLIYELLLRQQKKHNLPELNIFTEQDYDNISKIIICDPNKKYFIRNLEEHNRVQKRNESAALAGVATGTAASALVTTGVSELQSGISLSGMKKKINDYALSTFAPAGLALGATKIASKATAKEHARAEEKYKTKIQPQTINSIEDAIQYESDVSHILKQIGNKNVPETMIQKANNLVQTNDNYIVFIEQFIKDKYKKEIENRMSVSEDMKRKNDILQDEIYEKKAQVQYEKTNLRDIERNFNASKAKKKTTLFDTTNEQVNVQQNKLKAANNELEELEGTLVESERQFKQNNDMIKALIKEETNAIKEKQTKIGEQIQQLINKLNKAEVKVRTSTDKAMRLFTNNRFTRKAYNKRGDFDPLGIIPEDKSFRSRSSSKLTGGSKSRKRRRTRKST
jgi:organic radical activating enzyme